MSFANRRSNDEAQTRQELHETRRQFGTLNPADPVVGRDDREAVGEDSEKVSVRNYMKYLASVYGLM